MLQEYIKQHPLSEKAWMLLLSIYSSNDQAEEFEKGARGFLKINKDNPLWETIQMLGRTLDKDNPLYKGEDDPSTSAASLTYHVQHEHRPVGEILIELGYLSQQDMVNCLEDFDSKLHGRFGNYLVQRRQITHAQLNESLLQQALEAGVRERPVSPPPSQYTEELIFPVSDATIEDKQ